MTRWFDLGEPAVRKRWKRPEFVLRSGFNAALMIVRAVQRGGGEDQAHALLKRDPADVAQRPHLREQLAGEQGGGAEKHERQSHHRDDAHRKRASRHDADAVEQHPHAGQQAEVEADHEAVVQERVARLEREAALRVEADRQEVLVLSTGRGDFALDEGGQVELVVEIKERLSSSGGVILADYRGLSVKDMRKLLEAEKT